MLGGPLFSLVPSPLYEGLMCNVVRTSYPMVRVDLAKNGGKEIYEITIARCRVVLRVGYGRWLNARELFEDTSAI